MKYILSINLLIISFLSFKADAQSGFKATYELNFQADSTNDKNIESEIFLLYVNNDLSQFLSYNNALRDSIRLEIKKGNMTTEEIVEQTMNRPRTKFYVKINKIFQESRIENLHQITTELYSYYQPLKLMDWTLSNETKNINGYSCQKATTSYAGRNYIAWYDAEIPISDGPYKFYGLPGLIISIYDTKEHYKFDLVGLEKGNYEIKRNLLNEDYQLITEDEYKQMRANYKANAEAMAERVFSQMDGNKKPKKSTANNPIELE
ncbi:GLPGLI family protein [Marivirga arenosa]|uniref:GLPGLI family protein n=1 Tax=Marivirga arenosa TaxID=3059076 RepID=A0AA51N568_9BACT|nr:GLPGLI family protein [Marivirga sp. ABR2-2]WMN06477.1 GLPGLI family protein [Marivirga sp. ABR2-2]